MSENESGIGFERVGETLRRERLTRNINIETVASDLRLNSTFIIGIEEGDYSKLPNKTYVKMYIKTIAEYLSLDSAEILKRFSEEENIPVSSDERDRRDTITINVQSDEKPSIVVPATIITIAVIVVILLLKMYNGQGETTDNNLAIEDSLVAVDTAEAVDESLPKSVVTVIDTSKGDSLTVDSALVDSNSTKVDSTVVDSAKSSAEIEEPTDTENKKKEEVTTVSTFKFSVLGKADSVWVETYVDGKKAYKGFIQNKEKKNWDVKDSVNILVGKNSRIKYYRNDTPLYVNGPGLKILKITDDTLELWRMSKWKEHF